jgi:hypothetical protein
MKRLEQLAHSAERLNPKLTVGVRSTARLFFFVEHFLLWGGGVLKPGRRMAARCRAGRRRSKPDDVAVLMFSSSTRAVGVLSREGARICRARRYIPRVRERRERSVSGTFIGIAPIGADWRTWLSSASVESRSHLFNCRLIQLEHLLMLSGGGSRDGSSDLYIISRCANAVKTLFVANDGTSIAR